MIFKEELRKKQLQEKKLEKETRNNYYLIKGKIMIQLFVKSIKYARWLYIDANE